jgi:hypothetical protein
MARNERWSVQSGRSQYDITATGSTDFKLIERDAVAKYEQRRPNGTFVSSELYDASPPGWEWCTCIDEITASRHILTIESHGLRWLESVGRTVEHGR